MASFLQSLGKLASDVGTKYNLPEYRVSERLGYNPQSFASASPVVLGTNTSNPQQSSLNYSPLTSGSKTNPQYSPSSFGGGSSSPSFTPNQSGLVNQNANDMQSQADFEFDQALNLIGQQESAMRSEAEVGVGEQTLSGQQAQTRAGQAKQSNLQGLENEGVVAEKTATSGLKQARDLFRQLQQQNAAQLSGLGISSSSVTEALAERLGVETAQRIGGITGSLDEVRQNIAKEKTRVEEVFQSKLTEIQEGTQLAIQRIQAGLQQSLAQLGAARGQAATAKAQARTEIAVNARNQIFQIQQEAAQRAQSIQDAAARRAQALAEAEQYMFKPTDIAGMGQYIQQGLSTLPQVAGFQVAPTLKSQTVEGQGFIQPGFAYEKKPADDELVNPFQ